MVVPVALCGFVGSVMFWRYDEVWMARRLRVEFPWALYHVIARGNERKSIYRDDEDRQRYLDRLALRSKTEN